MGSTLKVDNIVGTSGTSAPITLSGDTATLGSGANIKATFSSVDNSATNGPSGTADGATTNTTLPIFACRAWVNFNGDSVTSISSEDCCAIRASGNVEKVVRTGTGEYVITFATAMPDGNYVMVGNAVGDYGTSHAGEYTGHVNINTPNEVTAASCKIQVSRNKSGTEADSAYNSEYVTIAFFR